ncbi:hypothetical protein J7E71_10120 [Mesobacillus foraminis]|uniref:hypothetical protein n=1 Tax=Mesobacillus foraminis TaxID=279826 RepID=UPI001BE98CF1|nr:hypothetical protein [Mesobacillus foraminis]MBT2756309.1 hypothetical protein [Mesobacillus foraminis]
MKRFFLWLFRDYRGLSSLIIFVISLSIINLVDYQFVRNNPARILPFLLGLILLMRVTEEIASSNLVVETGKWASCIFI